MDTTKTIAIALATALIAVIGFGAVTGGENLGYGVTPGVNMVPQTREVNVVMLDDSTTLNQGQSGSQPRHLQQQHYLRRALALSLPSW